MLASAKTTTATVPYEEEGDHHFILVEFPQLGATESVGFHLYEASILLSRYLASEYRHTTKRSIEPQHRRKRVLELGSGSCGLAGLAMTRLGYEVTFSDLPNILPYLRTNVERNALNPSMHSVEELSWTDPEACDRLGQFDVVIGADVVYQQEFIIPLLKTIMLCAKRDAWICAELRAEGLADEYFPTEAKKMGFHVKRIKQKFFPRPYCDEEGNHLLLFKLQKPLFMSACSNGRSTSIETDDEQKKETNQ